MPPTKEMSHVVYSHIEKIHALLTLIDERTQIISRPVALESNMAGVGGSLSAMPVSPIEFELASIADRLGRIADRI